MAPLPKLGDVGMWRDVVWGSAAGEGWVQGAVPVEAGQHTFDSNCVVLPPVSVDT